MCLKCAKKFRVELKKDCLTTDEITCVFEEGEVKGFMLWKIVKGQCVITLHWRHEDGGRSKEVWIDGTLTELEAHGWIREFTLNYCNASDSRKLDARKLDARKFDACEGSDTCYETDDE